MAENVTFHIYLIEADGELQNRMKTILSSIPEYEVHTFSTARQALDELESSRGKQEIAVIVSNYLMPKMKGADILYKAREISRHSKRILVADGTDMESVIETVNRAELHSCLVLPFEDSDFETHVENACQAFREIKKQENLSRVTRLQNKQLFNKAKEIKKKDELYLTEIRKRELVIKKLEDDMVRAAEEGRKEIQKGVLKYLESENVRKDQDSFGRNFSMLLERVKMFFSGLIADPSESIYTISYMQIRDKSLSFPEYSGLARQILIPVLGNLPSAPAAEKSGRDDDEDDLEMSFAKEGLLDDYLDMGLTENKIDAFIKIKKYDSRVFSVESIKAYLEINDIKAGIVSDEEINGWIRGASEETPPFKIAKGRPPEMSRNAEVRYHFTTDYLRAGTVKEDGTIDFKERGKIPFVKKDTFLAAKILPVEGTPGLNVLGEEIPVPEPEDMYFEAGSGARISEDGSKIYADTDGQPHLDKLGNVSVFAELEIKGDVDYNTGNVEFDGNLIVHGAVKEGFSVRAASLTCQEVQAADIILTGDLNCSSGIIDAKLVEVRGNIQAKFINNSTISSFGDMMIQKEIIDSDIRLSGFLDNSGGSIMSSEISAKGGIKAGNIGTESSRTSTLTVGVDKYVKELVSGIETSQTDSMHVISEITRELTDLNQENNDLHQSISQHAYVQDRTQLEMKEMEKKIFDIKASGNMQAYYKMTKMAEKLKKRAQSAEQKIEADFQRQDAISIEMDQKQGRMKQLEREIKAYDKQKNALLEMSARTKSVPELEVYKQVMAGTVVIGPNAKKKLKLAERNCKIAETKEVGETMFLYEMKVMHRD